MICPKCLKNELDLNTHGASIPYYQCHGRGLTGGRSCDFEMSVKKYEATYQGEMSRVERIRKKFDVGLMERNDFDYLLRLAES